MRPRVSACLVHAIAAAALGLLLIAAHERLLTQLPPFHADEAGHALPAARMAIALRHGDVQGFLAVTAGEALWPAGHPWFVTPFLLAGGISTHVARLTSLAAFASVLCLLPLFARAVHHAQEGSHPGDTPVALGWLSSAALAGAPLLWSLSCTVMTETLGMLLTILTLLTTLHAERRPQPARHAATGALAALTFLTKYNFGMPLVAALAAARILGIRKDGWRPTAALLLGSALPVGAWAALVFGSDPGRLNDVLRMISNRDEGLRGLDDLLFYPVSLVDTLGGPVASAVLSGVVLSSVRRRGSAAPILYVAFSLGMLTVHPNKQARYLAPVLPVMLALAECTLISVARFRAQPTASAAALAAILLVRNPLAQIDAARAGQESLREAQPIYDFVVDRAATARGLLVLGSTGLLPHLGLTWTLLERTGRESDVDLLLFPGGDDARYRTGYPAEPTPEYDRALDAALAERAPAAVVAIEIGPDSPFLPEWTRKWDAWGQNYVRAMAKRRDWLASEARRFPASDATVRVYRKRSAS